MRGQGRAGSRASLPESQHRLDSWGWDRPSLGPARPERSFGKVPFPIFFRLWLSVGRKRYPISRSVRQVVLIM